MSWKPVVLVGTEWSKNGLAFATEKEANDNALALMMKWTAVNDYKVEESSAPVNYAWTEGKLVAVA